MALDLAFVRHGEAGPPVVILHGLLGSARNWGTIGKQLAAGRRIFALDQRNHGASPWAPRMTYDDLAGDLRAFLYRHNLQPATLIGHSMGGKVAMRLASRHPELLARLVVVDIAPVAYAHDFGDYVRAMQAVDLAAISRRDAVDEALAATVPDPGVRAFLLQNLVRADDRYVWRVNLDAIAASMAELMAFPDQGSQPWPGPALVIAGERSDYVRREDRAAISALFPRADVVSVTGAGHWVHAEQPSAFLAHLRAFLGRDPAQKR
jgi:pimeloyl-ACP methyl ester carboxylesterase